MKESAFCKLARTLFSETLGSLGFSCEKSRFATFVKEDSEIYYFVMPDVGSSGTWYDINVFASSPVIDPLFHSKFPDSLGIPSDIYAYLSEKGIGARRQQFNCKNEEIMRNSFVFTVKPLLEQFIGPFFDPIQSIAALIPLIKKDYFLGFALFHEKRFLDAKIVLEKERNRLLPQAERYPDVQQVMDRIDEILKLMKN